MSSRRSDYDMGNDRAFSTCSTFLPSDTSPNEFYNKVDDLWSEVDRTSVMDDIASVVHMFIVDGELDEVAYLQYVEEHFGDQLDGLVDAFENGEPVQPVMPPSPSPKILYNRVSDKDVVDIGSGDCEKLKRCQARVVAVDLEPQENPHFIVNKLDCSFELRDFMEGKTEHVLTSFNSLTQLDSVEQVAEFDGVHIMPDMSVVKKIMAVDVGGEREVWGPFRDKDHGTLGDVIQEGYVAYNTYAGERVDLHVKLKIKTDATLVPQCEDIYYRPPDTESTPKYDGECFFLINTDGRPTLVGRNCVGFRLEGYAPRMVLMLEKLPLVGKPEAFCLIRVMEYKGYYPFHGLNNLREFCKKVKIKVGGIKIRPPGHGDLKKFATDGQIFRIGQLDYRYKSQLTVDLRDPEVVIKQLEDKYGYDIGIDRIGDGLCEYNVSNVNGSYRLVLKRARTDKTESTSVDKITRMLQWI